MASGPAAAQSDKAFERELFKSRFEHEINFRAAAIHVAWGAEALCDHVTEIEPFVLWSVHTLRRRLSGGDLALLKQATGMDDKWRVAWMDEGAPDDLKLGDVVVAVNDKPLPAGDTRFDMGAILRGSLPVSSDDQGFWSVMLKAREQAAEGVPMSITLADGRKLKVETQTGCAGSVTATAFDSEPAVFWRQGNLRAKIPANAMLEANSRDEFRWLAAFGTYFQASLKAIANAQQSEGRSNAFLVGKILTMAVPGAGMLLSAVEAQTERSLAVDSVVGSADLFATEVVTALGGEPAAGLRLNERMAAKRLKVDALLMDDFRRSTSAEHVRRLKALQLLHEQAQAEQDRAERQRASAPPAPPR
ncbi:MAG: hypothetical protein Q8N44_09840 [Rubrivivax sp.]|nr:hypothetical protein [Rubrivivax sp.]